MIMSISEAHTVQGPLEPSDTVSLFGVVPESTTRMVSGLDLHACEKDAMLVRFPLNRAIKAFGTILSICAVPLIVFVMKKFIINGSFHKNIKIILYCYFINALCQAAILPVCLIYMLSTSFSTNPCKIYLNRTVYILGHISNFYLILTQVNLQTVACIERMIATMAAANYEKQSAFLGSALATVALLVPILIMYGMYYDQDFQEPQPSVILSPSGVQLRVNYYCVYTIFLCIFSMILIKLLIWYNNKQSKKCIGQFCRRVQTNENITTTSFITIILQLQLSVYLISATGSLIIHLTDNLYDPYNLVIQTIKTTLFLVPVFHILLPITTYWEFNRVKKNRQKISMDHVFIKHTGEEGIQNYQKVIYDLWN